MVCVLIGEHMWPGAVWSAKQDLCTEMVMGRFWIYCPTRKCYNRVNFERAYKKLQRHNAVGPVNMGVVYQESSYKITFHYKRDPLVNLSGSTTLHVYHQCSDHYVRTGPPEH